MKVKLKSLMLLLLTVILTCSCTTTQTGNTTATTQTDTTLPKEPTPLPPWKELAKNDGIGALKNILKSHVNPSLDSLMEHRYSYVMNRAAPRGTSITNNSDVYILLAFHQLYTIEYIAMIDDDHVYIIYKLVDDRGIIDDSRKTVYMYRTFVREVYAEENAENWIDGETCEVYYFTNSLSHADFTEAFDVGDTMEDAIAIAPGLAFDLDNRYDLDKPNYFPPRPEIPTQTCFQLLEDGVLVLRFEANCTTDEWEAQGKPNSALICTAMEFYPNGTPATVDGIELTVLTAPADKRPSLPKGE